MKRFLIMAGGTGGHIFPGLAIAQALEKKGVEIHWLGTKKGLEVDLVPQNNIPLHFISIAGLRGKGKLALLAAPFRLVTAVWQSIKLVRKIKPDAVLGMGGFVSGPGGVAAWLTRTPLFIHEQNAIAGLTNKLLARFANTTFQAFPNTFASRYEPILASNPVRQTLMGLPQACERLKKRNGPVRLLVIGGSRGANVFNNTLPTLIHEINLSEPIAIWHQTGKNNEKDTKRVYTQCNVTARVEPFIDNMAQAYEWADVVLCRSGAITVSELATIGLPAILVPYPYAVDDHQTANGQYLVEQGSAVLMPETDFISPKGHEMIKKLLSNREILINMAKSARNIDKTDGTDIIVECLYEQTK